MTNLDIKNVEKNEDLSSQRFVQSKSKHFDTYRKAANYRKKLEGERIRIRRRKEGFDVVVFEDIKTKAAKEEKAETLKKEKTAKAPKKKFKKGAKKPKKKEKVPFNQIQISE